MRFTGHLDLHRAWERTFRRAGLPLAYSQGFNPHPRLNLASALPLGFTSEGEVIDVWLEQDLADLSEGNDAFADRVLGEIGNSAQTQLAHDVASVHFDGGDGDVQLPGYRR